MIKKIINMVKSLMSGDKDSLSSKRFVGLASFAIVALASLCNLFFKMTLVDYMFFGLLGLITACFGLNTIVSSKQISMGKKEDNDGQV
jgi:cadmium resistance protein CadD (predicted permease)